MSIANLNFFSKCLYGNTNVTVILPDCPYQLEPKDFYENGKKYKVLWLLHGTFGDSTDWIRRSNVELYATEKELIVVMPSALNTNYANWPSFGMGYNMYDFMFDELMPMIYNWFPASDKREDNFIAGLSMGGRGTCVYAFNHPEKFAGAGIFSASPRDFKQMKETEPFMWERMQKSVINYKDYEDFLAGPENTFEILNQKVGKVELPKLYFACGGDDMLITTFKEFQKHAEDIKLDAEFEIIPGYKHEWRFWDLALQKALDFFGIEDVKY